MKQILVGLHSLRGLAVVSIVIFHIIGIPKLEVPKNLLFMHNYFALGVSLFFVISAFSLYLSTFANTESPKWIKIYFIKRFFRIAPLFYLMVIVYIVVKYLSFGKIYDLKELMINLSFTHNLFPGKHGSIVWAGWTIGVEMLFYALVPILLITIRTLKASSILALCFIFVSILYKKIYNNYEYPSYVNMSLLGNIGVFGVGVPAFFVYEKFNKTVYKKKMGIVLLIASIASIALFQLLVTFNSTLGYDRIFLWSFAFATLIVSQSLYPFCVLSNNFFRSLGELSFSIYLIHPLVIYYLKPFYQKIYSYNLGTYSHFYLCVLITFLLVVPLAIVVYRTVEMKGINLGKQIIMKLRVRDKGKNTNTLTEETSAVLTR